LYLEICFDILKGNSSKSQSNTYTKKAAGWLLFFAVGEGFEPPRGS